MNLHDYFHNSIATPSPAISISRGWGWQNVSPAPSMVKINIFQIFLLQIFSTQFA
jgi:hypothetical protein